MFLKQSNYKRFSIWNEEYTKVKILTGTAFEKGVSFLWQLGEPTHVSFVSADCSLWHTSGSYCCQQNDAVTKFKFLRLL